jgi:hypothetical protein
MRLARLAACTIIGVGLLVPAAGRAQWEVTAKAALPAVPYWWTASESAGIDLVPVVWANDIDGGASGCCAVGAAVRRRVRGATAWLGLGFGTSPDGGTPAAIEAAVEIEGGLLAFRSLHGRAGFSAFYPLYREPDGPDPGRVSLGVSTVWLYDERYVPTVPLFDCPREAPSAPCQQVETTYPWSDGQDNALVAEAVWGRGEWSAPRLEGSLAAGLKLAGSDYAYSRAELEAVVEGRKGRARWLARLSAGWASGGAPLQRRFLLYGADPVSRWLSPYLEARGALLADVPYFLPGGPNLRAYETTRPLVKRYIGALGEVSRLVEGEGGFWGRIGVFLESAWTPGIPDRLGPEQLREDGSLLFDWRELPGEKEGAELGRFRARSLEVSELWADGGVAITGGYRRVAATISLPLWASEPAFANEPFGGGAKRAFAVRWTLTLHFFPNGRPGA